MRANVVRFGDEVGLVLPNEAVRMLGLAEGQEVHVTRLADGGYRIGVDDPEHEKAMRIVDKAMVEYADTLRALAKD